MTIEAFAPGTVIRARTRLWRVDAHRGTELVATSIDGGTTEQHRFYVPFEDIAPGHLDSPHPDKIGTPQANELLLRAFRLSMMHGSAPFLSIQRSCVIPTNYQLVPLVMALESPRVRLLLADDVGLGKTVEAGLIVSELLARQRASRLLVICPAGLREQWREALGYFFHIDARIVSTRHERSLQRALPAGANPWEFYRALITSVDYAKTPRVKHQILELLRQHGDEMVVVMDEAHSVAKPHQSRPDETVDMERWQLAEEVVAATNHLLLLTATPHNGYTDSYASLLKMVEPTAVSGPPYAPLISRSVAARHVCQRRRKDVEQWFLSASGQKSPFPKRDHGEVFIEQLTEQERAAIEQVREYGAAILSSAQGDPRAHVAQWAVLHLHKRGLSSPAALRCSLRNRRDSLQRKLKAEGEPADRTLDSVPPDVARANALDSDPGERFSEEEAGQRVERQAWGTGGTIEAELQQLRDVITAADKVTPARDSKLNALITKVLPERLATYPKVVIFTKYVDTLRYLDEQLGKAASIKPLDVFCLDGSLNETQRRERFIDFERSKRAVMIATDCISEGINLQHAAAQIIHYELPWNPNRLEQRNGRVDRFGQVEDTVYIRTLVMNDTLDATILKVLVEKAARIREDYGFSPPYFGDDQAILDLIQVRGLHIRTEGQQLSLAFDPDEDIPDSPFGSEVLDRIRSDSFYGQTGIQLPDVQSRLDRTYQAIGSPDEVMRFVLSGLSRFRCPVTENRDGTLKIVVTDPALQSAETEGVVAKATFDPEVALDDPDATVLDLGHPLVRRLIDVVKQSAFASGEHHGRTAYRFTPATSEVTALLHVLARFAVQTEPVTVLEELVPLAIPVYGDGVLGCEDAQGLLDARPGTAVATDEEVTETLRDLLAREDLDALIVDACATCSSRIAAERQALKARLVANGGEEATWLRGIDQLTLASRDLLTITVLYPA